MKLLLRPLLLASALVVSLSLAQPSPVSIKFAELYSKVTIRGVEMSPKLLEANGKRVEMVGYMAPPLKARIDFFVLTRTTMAQCPFCSAAADWPPDIVLVQMPGGREVTATASALRVRGRLDIGVKEDPTTGFVSLIRIHADELAEVRP